MATFNLDLLTLDTKLPDGLTWHSSGVQDGLNNAINMIASGTLYGHFGAFCPYQLTPENASHVVTGYSRQGNNIKIQITTLNNANGSGLASYVGPLAAKLQCHVDYDASGNIRGMHILSIDVVAI